MPEKKCFLCNRNCTLMPLDITKNLKRTIDKYECPACGKFSILRIDTAELKNNSDFMEKAKYLACERKLKGKNYQDYILHNQSSENIEKIKADSEFENLEFIHWKEFIRDFPENHEIPGRALINLGNAIEFGYSINLSDNSDESTFPSELLFAKKTGRSKAFELVLDTLENEKLIEYDIPQGPIKVCDVFITVTPDGWSRIARLREKKVDSKQIFVAMSFGKTNEEKIRQNKIWEEGIMLGIEGKKIPKGKK